MSSVSLGKGVATSLTGPSLSRLLRSGADGWKSVRCAWLRLRLPYRFHCDQDFASSRPRDESLFRSECAFRALKE